MPNAEQDQLKTALVELISRHIGQKTADMYLSYYEAQSPTAAITSAENLLAEFIGKDLAKSEVENVRAGFST